MSMHGAPRLLQLLGATSFFPAQSPLPLPRFFNESLRSFVRSLESVRRRVGCGCRRSCWRCPRCVEADVDPGPGDAGMCVYCSDRGADASACTYVFGRVFLLYLYLLTKLLSYTPPRRFSAPYQYQYQAASTTRVPTARPRASKREVRRTRDVALGQERSCHRRRRSTGGLGSPLGSTTVWAQSPTDPRLAPASDSA